MATHPPTTPDAPPAKHQPAERYRSNRRSELAIWWREIDRHLLMLVLVLMAIGAAAVAAASPASARRLSTDAVRLNELHFFMLHIRWLALGIIAMISVSFLSKDAARRLGIVIAGVALLMLMLVPLIGTEVNGARRWINLGLSVQPSSVLKAGFPITLAWILSWRTRDPNIPVIPISIALMGFVGALLIVQPDFGSTILYIAVWFMLVLLSGLSLHRIFAAIAGGVALIAAAYFLYDNARSRIDAFLGGGSDFDQVGLAWRTLLHGGWTGTGFWHGTSKFSLPEAHTDYILSVVGEEFGLLTCAVIIVIYFTIVMRVLLRLVEEEDLFTVLAGAGLVGQFGGQAFINVMVNLQLFPSKGMTLPFISYGGSSTIALSVTIGLLLAITRRNPFIRRERFSFIPSGANA